MDTDPQSRTLRRMQAVLHRLDALGVTHFLTARPAHIRYLTGFSGSNAICVISPEKTLLFTDPRYREQVVRETRGVRVIISNTGDTLVETLVRENTFGKNDRVGFERSIEYDLFDRLRAGFGKTSFLPTNQVIEPVAAVKDETEVATLKKAVAITETVFEAVVENLAPGRTEKDIAAEIAALIRRNGGDKEAFDIIAASGPNSALPHSRPSDRKLEKGDFLTLDFGARVDGYCADMTRTVVIGSADPKQTSVYQVVKDALNRSLKAAGPGIKASELDKVARDCIDEHGYGDFFGHSLGHGIGLEVHSDPRISVSSDQVLAEGHVITLEPGIYIEGWGGVRIEDDVVVTADGCRNLMTLSHDLIVVQAAQLQQPA